MKIAVIGYSGSGKSTLARFLGKHYHIPVLHLDRIHWLPGWKERPLEKEKLLVNQFMDKYPSWVIDGNYHKLFYKHRMEEADKIIFMNFNRFSCFLRAASRYFRYRGKTRTCMGKGCTEKLDFAFAKWILYEGRTKKYVKRYQAVCRKYSKKTVIVKNQRELNRLIKSFSVPFLGNIQP